MTKRNIKTGFLEKTPLMAVKHENYPAASFIENEKGRGGVEEGGVQELIAETWALIDKAKARLNAANVSEKDKIRWASVLASAISTLDKLLWKAGMSRVEEEDLASILSKIPEKEAKKFLKRLWKGARAKSP